MVRRTRKQLLSDLSALVKSAKKIPKQLASPEELTEPVKQLDATVDEVILKIFKLLIRGIRFLDAWFDHQDNLEALESKLNNQAPPTPPAESENRTFSLGGQSPPAERFDRNTMASPTFTNMSQCSTAFPSCFVTRPGSDYAPSVHCPERKASQLLKITFEELLPLMGHYIERLQVKPQHKITVQAGGYKLISCTSVFLNLVECVIDKHAVIGPLCASFDSLNLTIRDISLTNDEIRIESTDEKLDEATSTKLLELAVASVRTACECVARAGNVVSTIGDFDVEDLEMLQRNRWTGQEEFVPKQPVTEVLNEDVSKSSESLDNGSVSEPTRPVTAIDKESKELPPPPPPPKDNVTSIEESSEVLRKFEDAPILPKDGTKPGINSGSTAGGSTTIIMQEPEMATLAKTSSLTSLRSPTPSLSRKSSYLGPNLLSRENSLNGRPSSRLDSMAQAGLLFSKDGTVSGGTLAALVERLTMHDSTPEVTFVNAFYITFRCFATPMDFAEALIERFDSVAEEADVIAVPVRLRVYNVFKGWLECHWQKETDEVVLPMLEKFAGEQLTQANAAAGQRLKDLAQKVTSVGGPLVPRMVGAIGSAHLSTTETFPSPIITRNQLNALKRPANVSITDLDPLEIARQLAIKTGKIFCSIMPEELLSQTWIKHPERAPNVKAMAVFATKITRIVAESILFEDDTKRRAMTLKQWIKVADRCLEMSNYDSAMAITTSLESSCISRLKKTWDEVPLKHKATLERLREVMGCAKNYTVLRARVRDHVPPCIPFIGPFLTDVSYSNIFSDRRNTNKLSSSPSLKTVTQPCVLSLPKTPASGMSSTLTSTSRPPASSWISNDSKSPTPSKKSPRSKSGSTTTLAPSPMKATPSRKTLSWSSTAVPSLSNPRLINWSTKLPTSLPSPPLHLPVQGLSTFSDGPSLAHKRTFFLSIFQPLIF